MAKKTNQYSDDSIQVLEGLEGIRKRFDMYVGGKDSAAFHLVKEIIDNSIDEVLNGHATRIKVWYLEKENRVVIEDDGRGLPTGMHPKMKRPTIEVLFTHLHAGGKFDKESFKVSGGKNGIGIKATNALSSELLVDSFYNGEHYQMTFSRGKVVEELKKISNTKKRGTRVSFIPDTEILGKYAKLNPEMMGEELDLRAYINAGLEIDFINGSEEKTYVHENGIRDFLNDINTDPMTNVVEYDFDDENGNNYQIVFNYANGVDEHIRSFVNGIVTSKGTHETGFRAGLTTAMLDFIKKHDLLTKQQASLDIKGEDVREGLYAIINLKHTAPEFRGQVKDELSNSDVTGIVRARTHSEFTDWLESNPAKGKELARRVIAFAKGRKDAATMKSKIIKVNSGSSGLAFDPSFDDCTSNDISENEIFVIEGDSAGGNVSQGRDPKTQAVFPLRGKPLNTYGLSYAKLLSNKEIRELFKVLFGTTDINKIKDMLPRYGLFLILADADDDGYHIASLLLAFIAEYAPQLIEQKRVRVVQSPLYRVRKGSNYIYFKNDKEYDKFLVKEIGEKYGVSEIDLGELISKGKEYTAKFNLISNRYSISEDIMNMLENYQTALETLDSEDLEADLRDMGLEVTRTEEGIKIEGLQGDVWHSVTLGGAVAKEIEELAAIFPENDVLTLTDKKTGEIKEDQYVYNVLEVLNSSVKFVRERFKGLGEANFEELKQTTLHPRKRDEIIVTMEDIEQVREKNKLFFGNNADLRKDFIQEHLA
jgi:DNA gyrase subunit B